MADVPDLETPPHAGRVRAAIDLGRRSRTDPRAAAELAGWHAGGFTHRLLAAYAGHGSLDATATAALAADPSRYVAGVALKTLRVIADDATLAATVDALPPRRLPRVLAALRRRRPAVVDRVIAARLAAGDPAAWPLAPLASAATLDAHFANAAERGGSAFWCRLAAAHPARAAAEVVARLNALTSPDGLLFSHAGGVIDLLADRRPELALEVVNALRAHRPLDLIPLQTLARRRPEVVAGLVLAAGQSPAVSFERVAHRFPAARLVALFRRGPHLLGDAERWLARLPAAERAAVYRELGPAWTAADGTVPVRLLRRLPASDRASEARRVLALPTLAARPLQRLPYAGLLPWEEAVEQTAAWGNHPEADHRAAALAALCEAARFDRTRLGDLLVRLVARKHEQDPVRAVFLAAVAALPPRRWTAEHLPALGQVVRDALAAADLSPVSANSVGRLLFALLPVQPEWAVAQLAEVTADRGFPSATARRLEADDVRRIAPAFGPVVAGWSGREHGERLIALAAAVGKHLPLWPVLAAAVERVAFDSAFEYTAASALRTLLEHLPGERERLVLAALKHDKTWAYSPPVLAYLHARRQDLLTPYLGRTAFKGRFATGKVRYVLPLDAGFFRWTDAQQEAFATTLAELAAPPRTAEDTQTAWDVLAVVRRLPALPAIGPERLVRLANDEREAVREAAVRALGRVDARRGVPELLAALGDKRARWAVYALRAALAEQQPAAVLGVLHGVPLTAVTVAKEAVRLAGEFGGAAAVGWFAELNAKPLHRDVRGAMLRALWDHLDSPAAWELLDANTASPEVGVVIGLARIPVDRASADARRRVAGLMLRLLAHPEPTVRVAVLDRLATQPVPDGERVLLTATLAALGSAIPDERAGGVRAAVAGATDADAPQFRAAFTDLLPRRRELAAAVELFAAHTRGFGGRLTAVRAAVLISLTTDPATIGLQVTLAAATLWTTSFGDWAAEIVGTDRGRPDTPQQVLAELSGRNADDLDAVERDWATQRPPVVRWLAVRLLAQTAATHGWTPARLDRLDAHRRDPSPTVADAAAFTFPPDTPA